MTAVGDEGVEFPNTEDFFVLCILPLLNQAQRVNDGKFFILKRPDYGRHSWVDNLSFECMVQQYLTAMQVTQRPLLCVDAPTATAVRYGTKRTFCFTGNTANVTICSALGTGPQSRGMRGRDVVVGERSGCHHWKGSGRQRC